MRGFVETIDMVIYLPELDPQFISSAPHLPTRQNPTFPVAGTWTRVCRK